MIKLHKIDKPQILVDNDIQWTAEYLSYIHAKKTPPDTIAHRYNQPSIKDSLESETYGKCAYCESKIKHIEFGDIEHILPKNKDARPDLYVNWENLTLACEICNRINKKDYYNPSLPLINPYVDEPEDHFLFLGAIITDKSNDVRAYTTHTTLDLNRDDLVIRRNERLKSINRLVLSWETQADPSIKNVLAKELLKECEPNAEYSAFVKHFLISKGLNLENIANS
ncbi:MAG: HNH endonuclease [Roseburia sp.]|nr:HNH endonuclease [Roseburia sp.]